MVRALHERRLRPVRAVVGPLMTALDMVGASLSVLPLATDDDGTRVLSLIDAPTRAPAWPVVSVLRADKPHVTVIPGVNPNIIF